MNIAEQIIEAYRQEDLVRSYQFDLDAISTHVISHLPISTSGKKKKILEFASLVEHMNNEQIVESGHLSQTHILVKKLFDTHESLLIKDQDYALIFDNALPYISKNIEFSHGQITNPISICLNGIYGLLLLRLEGKVVPDDQLIAITHFGNVLSYLSFKTDNPAN